MVERELFGRLAETEMSPGEYYNTIRQLNDLFQRELSEKIGAFEYLLGSGIVVSATGSDVRREKGSAMSPVEFLVVTDERIDPRAIQEALGHVLSQVTHHSTGRPKVIEIKKPDKPLYTFNGREDVVQPGRVADMRSDAPPLYGSLKDVTSAKKRLGEELRTANRSVIDRIANLPKDARKVVDSGKNRIHGEDAVHFDIENGVVFYNPGANQFSFKIGPLRFVQNTLLYEAVRHIRQEQKPDFLSTLPSGIVHRLEQLSEDKMVNRKREDVDQIAEHYMFFLKLYHKSEEQFLRLGERAYQLSESEKQEVAKRLTALLELMKGFKIQTPQS